MLRALFILAVPCATLLASPAQRPDHSLFQGAQGQVDLADIPIAQSAAKTASSELNRLRESAEMGDLNAQAQLGVMYYWGQGAPQDWAEAQVWLRKASERGHMDAQAKLGAMCFLGQGGRSRQQNKRHQAPAANGPGTPPDPAPRRTGRECPVPATMGEKGG